MGGLVGRLASISKLRPSSKSQAKLGIVQPQPPSPPNCNSSNNRPGRKSSISIADGLLNSLFHCRNPPTRPPTMARAGASKLARAACRSLQTSRVTRTSFPSVSAAPAVVQSAPIFPTPLTARRFISNSSDRQAITPDAKAPKTAETPEVLKTPADITEDDYHTVADEYLDKLISRLEQLQDEREDVDVEYSVRHPPPPLTHPTLTCPQAGVLTLALGSDEGTYVINKQPPNKQIWLSSPKTGPKRYDYVVFGEGQHEKQDTATGDWVYLRDGSTLNDLLAEEIGIDIRLVDTELGS